jgi:hypothetical protein
MLKKALGDKAKDHIIATTSSNKGNLIKIAKQEGFKTFYIPDGVGGRFSELCPVGLLAAAVVGIDIKSMLEGAAYMDKICKNKDYKKNPALAMAVFKRNKSVGIKSLKISLSGKVCFIDALSDTGNLLTEPISKFPVIIAEERKLTNLFPNGIPDINSPDSFNMNMRLIPYSSLGKKDGMLIGFIPDEVTIDGKKAVKTVVAISPDILSVPGEYGALFNPNILV